METSKFFQHDKIQRKTLSFKKIMAPVFWDFLGVTLIEFMEQGTTINGKMYLNILTNFKDQ